MEFTQLNELRIPDVSQTTGFILGYALSRFTDAGLIPDVFSVVVVRQIDDVAVDALAVRVVADEDRGTLDFWRCHQSVLRPSNRNDVIVSARHLDTRRGRGARPSLW